MADYFDSHADLTSEAVYNNLEEMLARARAAGITRLVNVCTDLQTLERGLALSKLSLDLSEAPLLRMMLKRRERQFLKFLLNAPEEAASFMLSVRQVWIITTSIPIARYKKNFYADIYI